MLDSEKELLVNSFHHQAIKEPAPEFITTATAPDGINEAMEHPEKEIFSVQWHPEAMAANDDEEMLKTFQASCRIVPPIQKGQIHPPQERDARLPYRHSDNLSG